MNSLDLSDVFRYEDGKLFWKIKPANNIHLGDEAGCETPKGYTTIHYAKKYYQRHRIVYYLFTGEWPDLIDHKDQDPTNDRFENLRPTTRSLNAHNSDKTWGDIPFRGVSFYKKTGKFRASIWYDNKQRHIGFYKTAEEAAEAYNQYKQVHTTHLMRNMQQQ